ncbi:mitochondrial carrier homolog 1-like isoform X2 [Periophthalmus magnuspinnatus]|uniref:mitochondrial carrier homolog 1-like isoform X2 n=1 Tax=Periophthalmus magnuspinnatus TaxID=409849 RepID=UPI002436C1A8|nr:mitochondrial carrier homolog 1-like isoform X2 [Periophthalmus magnuspinnatus]
MDPPENQAGAEVSDVDREETPSPAEVLSAAVLLGAGATAIQHPVIYIKLLIQVGHEPLPPTWGTTLFGRKVLYLPGLFSYAQHILQVDGKCGLFRGLSPHIVCCAVSTVVKRKVKQMELISAKEEQETSLKALVKDTSHEMLVRCLSRVACHPFHVLSVRCMAQFVGREVKYSGMLSCMVQIFKEEGLAGFYVGLVPHVLGELLYLWGYNLLCHFINTYAEDDTSGRWSSSVFPSVQVMAALLEPPVQPGKPIQRLQLVLPPGSCQCDSCCGALSLLLLLLCARLSIFTLRSCTVKLFGPPSTPLNKSVDSSVAGSDRSTRAWDSCVFNASDQSSTALLDSKTRSPLLFWN